jgi:hypothetical protein
MSKIPSAKRVLLRIKLLWKRSSADGGIAWVELPAAAGLKQQCMAGSELCKVGIERLLLVPGTKSFIFDVPSQESAIQGDPQRCRTAQAAAAAIAKRSLRDKEEENRDFVGGMRLHSRMLTRSVSVISLRAVPFLSTRISRGSPEWFCTDGSFIIPQHSEGGECAKPQRQDMSCFVDRTGRLIGGEAG